MKKIVNLLMILVLILSLAACGEKKEENTSMDLTEGTTTEATTETTTEATTETTTEATTEATTETTTEVVEEASVEELVKAYFENMPEHIYKIGEADFVAKVNAGDDMVILDIRSAADYETGHVKGAINLPWGTTAISDNLKFIPQDKEVFLYCYTGQTAGQAVVTLNIAGINARSVNLGWNLGISKTEGIEAITETAVNPIGTTEYAINSNVQEAVSAYYSGLSTIEDERFKNYKVSEADLKAMMDAEEDFYLISARKPEDYAAGHIKGAVNIPFGKTMLNDISGIPMDKKVVVYCYTGQTAGQATAAYRLLGYDVVSLNGGTGTAANAPNGWINAGFEVVTE